MARDEIHALFPVAFRLAKAHESERKVPVGPGSIVIWKEGEVLHGRTFKVVRRVGNDRAVISGWPDDHEGGPVEREVPWADIVDGDDMLRAGQWLAHESGLCSCYPGNPGHAQEKFALN